MPLVIDAEMVFTSLAIQKPNAIAVHYHSPANNTT